MSKTAQKFYSDKFLKANKHNLITHDTDMLSAIQRAFAASGTDLPVLLLGETGVGKEVISIKSLQIGIVALCR